MDRSSERDSEYRGGESGVKYMMRGPTLDWGVIRLLSGQSMPGHLHQETEEVFYIKSGSAKFTTGGETVAVEAGDALRFEIGEDHAILNDGEDILDLVFIKHPYNPEDKVDC